MSWDIIKLGKIADFKNGLNFDRSSFGTGIKVINVASFGDKLIPQIESLPEINPDGIVSENFLLKSGDILFVRSNGNKDLVGRCMFIPNIQEDITFSGFCIRCRIQSPQINNIFYAYLFKTSLIRRKLSNSSVGTNISNLNQRILSSLDIPFPKYQIQQKIASILSAYDDLIENNLKRIKLLEEAAQNIYKEWFVNMRFPNYENVSINEDTGLPEGWVIKNLEDLCSKIASGGTPSRNQKTFWEGGNIDWVTTKELKDGFIFQTKEKVTEEGLNKSSAKFFPAGTIVMAIYASPTLGRLGILTKESCFNQAAVGFICNRELISNEFLYYKLLEERQNLNNLAIGAAQQNINVGKVKNHGVVLPNLSLIDSFSELVNSNFNMRRTLGEMNYRLKEARDILLPRLMNRTIEV